MIKSKTSLLFIILSLGFTTKAQFNDSTFYQVNYAATGIINRTNDVSSYLLSNAVRFNIRRKDIRLNTTNSWIYGRQQQRLTNNDFSSSLDFNLYKTLPHFNYWGLATYDKSYSLRINERYQAGLGVAYNVFDKASLSLNVSDGVLYENSNLKINDSTSERYHLYRNSLRIRYRLVYKEIIVFNGTNLLQNALNNRNDYIVSSVNSLSFRLRKWLSLTASANYNKVQKTRRENLLLTLGLSAETYF